jgi:hypothetical protein
MTMQNLHFGSVDGAAFELPGLIQRLGYVGVGKALDQDRCDMVAAIATHCGNVQSTLLDGIFSIAHLLVESGCSEDDLEKVHITGLGALLKHLAYETDYARITLSNMRRIQQEQLEQKASTDTVRRRTSKKDSAEGQTP